MLFNKIFESPQNQKIVSTSLAVTQLSSDNCLLICNYPIIQLTV